MHQSNNIKVDSAEDSDSLLVFKINNTYYCTRAESVLSISEPQAIYKIPLTPKSIAGITIFQGGAVPVYCLATCLGESLTTRNRNGVIFFVKTIRQPIGVWVDDTSDIIEVSSNDYIEPDDIVKSDLIKYCIPNNEKLLLYIDFEFLGNSHGRQNSWASLSYSSSVQQPVPDSKSQYGKLTDKQLPDDSDDLVENADLTVNNTFPPNPNLDATPAHEITPVTNDKVNNPVALDTPENTNAELNKGEDNNKTDTQPAVESHEESNKPEPETRTIATEDRFSRQTPHFSRGLPAENHERSRRVEHTINTSVEHTITTENRVEEYPEPLTAQGQIQHVRSSEGRDAKSARNPILWVAIFVLVLFLIFFFISKEKNISGNQRKTDVVLSKKDSFKEQKKSVASESYDAKLSTNDKSEVHSVTEAGNQVKDEHVNLADEKSAHKSAPGKTDTASTDSSKLKSFPQPVSSEPEKKLPASSKESAITKTPASSTKQAETLPENQGANQQNEQEKTVIVELSTETFQIIVERFVDQRAQLANRQKSRKTSLKSLPGDSKVEVAKLKRQLIDTAATKPGSKKEIESNLQIPDGTSKDLSRNPDALKTVTTKESRTVRPPNSKFEEFRYVVSRGDTLWDIAAKFLGDPFKYKLLSEYSHVRDPDWIYPGDVVIIRKKIQ